MIFSNKIAEMMEIVYSSCLPLAFTISTCLLDFSTWLRRDGEFTMILLKKVGHVTHFRRLFTIFKMNFYGDFYIDSKNRRKIVDKNVV